MKHSLAFSCHYIINGHYIMGVFLLCMGVRII